MKIYRVTVGSLSYITTARSAAEAKRIAELRYGVPALPCEVK